MKLSRQGDCTFLLKTILRFRCPRTSIAFLIVSAALTGTACRASEALPAVQPPSAWVTPRQFDRPPANDPVDPSQDYRWLLYDRQINAQNDEEFVHEVQQPLTLAGVQFASHVLINYDPTCQSLTFHWARLWRGTNKLDRLDPSTLRLTEPSPDAKQ